MTSPGPSWFRHRLADFAKSADGAMLVTVALLSPILLGLTGAVIDYMVFDHHRTELQEIADAAAVAAASEASLKGWNARLADRVADASIASNLTDKFAGSEGLFDHSTDVREDVREVEVTLTQDHFQYLVLGHFLGSPQVTVRSIARASGLSTICIIVQSTTAKEAMHLDGNSRVSANGCSAYSNSSHPKGISAKGAARLTAKLACSGGGYAGSAANFSPLPLTDCPTISDPLTARGDVIAEYTAPLGCNFKKTEIKGKRQGLTPGVYCGGLEISGGSTVTFAPGIYVIRDGAMKVKDSSVITGTRVGFVFEGDAALLELRNESVVSLTAPTDGPMAGIVIDAPAIKKARNFRIESRNAAQLLGTVYLPGDNLTIGGDDDGDGLCDPDPADPTSIATPDCISEVGTASAWTVIISKTLKVTAGATLELNSNYTGSKIPVPQGVGPTSSPVSLVH